MTETKPDEFQIDPKTLHTGNFLADKVVDSAVHTVNELDINKDGISDVAQVAELYEEYKPAVDEGAQLALKLAAAIDFEHMAKAIADAPWVKDRALVAEIAADIAKLIEQVSEHK